MCRCNPSVRTPFCGKPGCEVPAAWKAKPPSVTRQGLLDLVARVSVPLAGFHLADRNQFAAFNMGRLQQAILQAVEEMGEV